ncbi:MAG: ParB family transcriptional regulator, chromosome partitioning protein [Actinomycetota bacterium]|nr:ParB family transcriptional regulator, chromosome partitioning protein [Actinomycetota bacterium]
MSEKRRGLGRGLGALIPNGTTPMTRPVGERPVDVFFPEHEDDGSSRAEGGRDVATGLIGTPHGRTPLIGGPPAQSRSGGVPTSPQNPSGPSARSGEGATPGARTEWSGIPVTGAAVAGVPVTATRVAGQPVTDTSVTDTPVTDTPVAGEPATDTPVTDTPVTGEPPSGVSFPDPSGGPEETDSPRTASTDGDLLPVPGAYFAELPVNAIRPNPKQPRQVFDEESLAELVHSVREIGVLQPVVVRRITGVGAEDAPADDEPQFELIMGERRLRACRDAGLDSIPAIVRDTQDDELLRDALLENLHRSQLNPLEEAAAYQQLLDDFGCTHEELASRIGRSRPQISNTIRLLKLPPLVQRRVAAAVLSAGHARALLGLEDSAAMERLAQRIVAEGLSVRAVEEVVALGDGTAPKPAKRRPRAGTHRAELDDLATRLGDRLDTRVAISLGRSKGRLSIDFASVDDLNRILGTLSPDLKGAFLEN